MSILSEAFTDSHSEKGNECCVAWYHPETFKCHSDWNSDIWSGSPDININQFHPQSSAHRPVTTARLAYDKGGIGVCFRVQDRYVVSRHDAFMSPVCKDSCVEFFFQPDSVEGYFNFEINCSGTLYASYITDPQRVDGGFRGCTPFAPEDADRITVNSDFQGIIEEEITDSIEWCIAVYIPFEVLADYCGDNAFEKKGWRCNLYKCADESSHPHWAAWRKFEKLDFHQPALFGALFFSSINKSR